MVNVINTFSLDMHSLNSMHVVRAKLGDTARTLTIYLSEGAKTYAPDPRGFVILAGKKPDNTILYQHCDIQEKAIVYHFTEQTVSCVGQTPAELRIFGPDGKLVQTARFIIEVEPQVTDDHTIASVDEKTAIDALMGETLAVKEDVLRKLRNGVFIGESAYEEAVRLGYKGTEEQWLASLRYDHSEEFTALAGQVRQNTRAAAESAEAAGSAAQAADSSALQAGTSEGKAAQAMSDLLAMLGTDIATLVGGKIPMSQIPATATQEVYEITEEGQLTGLVAQRADLAELLEVVEGVKTVTKTWQLLGDGNPAVRENWIVWGTSYAVQSGNATMADAAENASTINGHRMVEMEKRAFETAVKDPAAYYLVHDSAAEV